MPFPFAIIASVFGSALLAALAGFSTTSVIAVAGLVAAAAIAITMEYIDKCILKEILKDIKKEKKEMVQATIMEKLDKGDYKEVYVGLLDRSGQVKSEVHIRSDEVAPDIYKGQYYLLA